MWISLSVIFACSMFTDVSRFVHPSGEKYIPSYLSRGQMDFSYPYLGARALLAGENPYTTTSREYTHQHFKPVKIDGVAFKQLYPPSHVWMYVPLALVFGEDVAEAGRVFYYTSLVCLALLGVLTWRLSAAAAGNRLSPFFAFLAVAALALHPGAQLGLERGQGDIVTAFLCWAAVVAVVRQELAAALFLAVWATAFKAYPVLFTAGLGLLAARRKVWIRAAAGALVGAVVFILPVAHLLPLGLKASRHRSDMFWNKWYNHGFKNLVHELVSPGAADLGRQLLTALALIAAALWAWRAWQHRNNQASSRAVLALVLFSTCSLLAMVGFSALSVSYNLILVLPGVLVLAASQDELVDLLKLNSLRRHLLGASVTLSAYCLFLYRWGEYFPLAGLGLVMLLVLLLTLAIAMPPPPGEPLPASA